MYSNISQILLLYKTWGYNIKFEYTKSSGDVTDVSKHHNACIQAGKLKIFGTHPNWVVSYIAYTKFHSPSPVFHLPHQIFTRIGERASASFPAWYMGHGLKLIRFYVQKYIAALAISHNPSLVCDKPLGVPASVKLVYYLGELSLYLTLDALAPLCNQVISSRSIN